MDFDLSDMQQMLTDSARKLIANTYSLEDLRRQRSIPDGLNRKNWSQFAELGWLGLPLPEDVGGLGCSFEDVVVLSTMLGRALAVEPYVSTVVIGGCVLGNVADADRRRLLLSGIATGELRVALAHEEQGERYDDRSARTTTARVVDGGFVLNGSKMLVVDGPSATHLIVSAQLDQDLGLFLVSANASGLSRETYLLVDGAAAADLVIGDVRVEADALIARGSAAEGLLSTACDRANLALMAQAVGAMEAALEVCSAYLKERKQFGQPIGKFQALQHIMADMFVSTHQSRSILYCALSKIDSDAVQRRAAISTAKIVIGEAAQLVSRSGIQLHGGYGVTDEFIISHYFRRLLSLEKQFGDIDFHVRRLAEHVLG
jgi:alkylation response protein AidB-like acyl-CoA dehydrogenase